MTLPYRNSLKFFLCSLICILPLTALAESSTRHGDYTIHYNALQTDILDPAIANSYGIKRSTKRGLLNIAIRKNQEQNAFGEAASGDVSATWSNLNGQMGKISLREIREKNAIYYIGEFAIRNEETLTFNITVSIPASRLASKNISFRKQFFVN